MTYRQLLRAIHRAVVVAPIRRKLIHNIRDVMRCHQSRGGPEQELVAQAKLVISILDRVVATDGACDAFFRSSRWVGQSHVGKV
jgi:hypothetical protein